MTAHYITRPDGQVIKESLSFDLDETWLGARIHDYRYSAPDRSELDRAWLEAGLPWGELLAPHAPSGYKVRTVEVPL